jgi:allantoin racemase
MIRLLNQNIAELDGLPHYVDSIKKSADAILGDGTVLDVWGMKPGTYAPGTAPIESLGSPWGHYLANLQMVQGAIRAEKEGYDAVIFTCFHDPGVAEARSAVNIPVIAACESALLTAFTLAPRVGMVGINPANAEYIRGLVRAYGFEGRVVDIMPLDVPVNEVEMNDDFARPGAMAESFARVARPMIARGAGVVIPAEMVLNRMLRNQGVVEIDGMPVLDAFTNALLYGELMVKLWRATGVRRDRAVHPMLSEAQIAALSGAAKSAL